MIKSKLKLINGFKIKNYRIVINSDNDSDNNNDDNNKG